MTITVTRRITLNGQSIEWTASSDLPIALDHDDIAIRILVMRVALKQSITPILDIHAISRTAGPS